MFVGLTKREDVTSTSHTIGNNVLVATDSEGRLTVTVNRVWKTDGK